MNVWTTKLSRFDVVDEKLMWTHDKISLTKNDAFFNFYIFKLFSVIATHFSQPFQIIIIETSKNDKLSEE